MTKRHPMLANIEVSAPCPASWDKMSGDDRVRFCQDCKLNVYNLSDMSASEAEELILQKEGRLCVRFFQRQDGTVLTDNCPVGLRRIRNFGRKVTALIALSMSWLITSSNQPATAEKSKCPEVPSRAHATVGIFLNTGHNITAYRVDLIKQIADKWHRTNTGPTVNVVVSKAGAIKSVEIVKSTGESKLDVAAIKTIKSIKAAPLPPWFTGDEMTFTFDMSRPVKLPSAGTAP